MKKASNDPLPLGVRLNNPGNLEWGSPWQGLVPRDQSRYYSEGTPQQARFCEFQDAAFGIRAIALTLMTYYDKRQANDGSRIDTIREIIERWAPAVENNVEAYSEHVAEEVKADPYDILDLNDYNVMRGLVKGIIAHENAGYTYPEPVLEEGLRRAGFVPQTANKALPVSVETIAGAAVPVIAGAIQVMPEVVELVKQQEDNLTSGDWTRMAMGIMFIVTGAMVAWSQYKRRSAGAA